MQRTMYQRSYYTLFLFYRLVLTLILVYLYEYPNYQISIIMVMQVIFIGYLIKFRPFKSELQQVIVVTDEFTIIVGVILLFFIMKHQTNMSKSQRVWYIILGVVCLSLLKNIGTILYLAITKSYVTFRNWVHKKWGVDNNQKKSKKEKQNNVFENDATWRPIIQPITQPLEQNSEVLKNNRPRKRRRRHKSQKVLSKLLNDLKSLELEDVNDDTESNGHRKVHSRHSSPVSNH